MLRSARVLRRAGAYSQLRRHLHEDSRGDFLGFASANIPGADPRYGMDMTRAPGYEVAADEDPPLVGNQKLADFAARHARLSSAQISHADGYLWIGSVLYPNSIAHHDFDVEFSWERDVPNEKGGDPDFEKPSAVETGVEEKKDEVVQASRRYTGGQARRIRKERERSAAKRASRRLRKKGPAIRKPENDIPDGES